MIIITCFIVYILIGILSTILIWWFDMVVDWNVSMITSGILFWPILWAAHILEKLFNILQRAKQDYWEGKREEQNEN